MPVSKRVDALELGEEKDIPLGDRKNMVYMGSTVVYGRGRAVVTDTGMNTEMGKIADALTKAQEEQTPLQMKLNQLSKILSCPGHRHLRVHLRASSLVRAYPNISGTVMLDTFMVAVSLAVAAIPEGLAAVVTIVLSIGVTNMSKRNAVIRKLTAVETLGCTQIICSDKTGTLTQNKMTVVEHARRRVKRLLGPGHGPVLATRSWATTAQAVGEPTECALVNYARQLGLNKNRLDAGTYPRDGRGSL